MFRRAYRSGVSATSNRDFIDDQGIIWLQVRAKHKDSANRTVLWRSIQLSHWRYIIRSL